jgi:flagellar hook-basal body complex protein FliE
MRVEPLKMTPVAMRAETHFGEAKPSEETKSFGEFLSDAIGSVNDLQLKSNEANIKMAAGQVNDISEVMVASAKAGIALQLTSQIRNRVVEAYQEVMRMQV